MKTINKYIKFAKDNWLELHSIDWESKKLNSLDIIYLITSKKFIEAIARWIISREFSYSQFTEEKLWIKCDNQKWFIDILTFTQAIAIRDKELDIFIKNLLWQI